MYPSHTPETVSRRRFLTALTATAVAGCSQREGEETTTPPTSTVTDTAGPSDSPSVEVMTDLWSEPWRNEWQNTLIPEFESQSTETVSLTSPPQYHPTFRDRASSGEFPELFTSTAVEAARYILRQETTPVTDITTKLADRNGPLLTDHSMATAGTAHIVPHGMSAMVLNYRRDIYDTLGLSVPATWDDLLANARAISESDQVAASGFAVPGTATGKSRPEFISWLYSAGGALWKRNETDESTVEVAFDDATVRSALEYMRALSAYSPPPSQMGFAGLVSEWVQGNVAQCLFPNAWLAEASYTPSGANPAVAMETRQAAVPLRDSSLSPPTRGRIWITGTPLFRDTNTTGAGELLEYLYHGPDAQAARNGLTMQHLPPYEGIIGRDAYQHGEIYRAEGGHFWELEKTLMNDVIPEYTGERPRTPAAWYAVQGQPPTDGPSAISELVATTVGDDGQIEPAISTARMQLQRRLDEGRSL